MSVRREMNRAARAGCGLLPNPTATREYLRSRLTDEGGFADKAGRADLYYTVFGLQAAMACGVNLPVERIRAYLLGFGDGAGLDLVHLSCLARAWAELPGMDIPSPTGRSLSEALNARRSDDGGFSLRPEGPGSIYGCFVAVGGLQDLNAPLAEPDRIAAFLETLRTPAGGYVNETALPFPATPSTAAALTLQKSLGFETPATSLNWLADQQDDSGGFHPVEGAPVCDLLSTATAMHALSVNAHPLGKQTDRTIEFILRHTGDHGGFGASTLDATPDVEYTAYALVALGHLGRQ